MTYTIKFTTPFDTIEYIKVEAKTISEAVNTAYRKSGKLKVKIFLDNE